MSPSTARITFNIDDNSVANDRAWSGQKLSQEFEATLRDTDLPLADTFAPNDGDILTFDGAAGEWVPGAGGGGSLGELSDVDPSGVTDGQALIYDNASSSWIPGDVSIDLSEYARLDGATFTGTIESEAAVESLKYYANLNVVANNSGSEHFYLLLHRNGADQTQNATLGTLVGFSDNVGAERGGTLLISAFASGAAGSLLALNTGRSGVHPRLVTLDYNGNSYVAIDFTDNSYPEWRSMRFTGMHGSSGPESFTGVLASSVSNVTEFSSSSTEHELAYDGMVVSRASTARVDARRLNGKSIYLFNNANATKLDAYDYGSGNYLDFEIGSTPNNKVTFQGTLHANGTLIIPVV